MGEEVWEVVVRFREIGSIIEERFGGEVKSFDLEMESCSLFKRRDVEFSCLC